MGKSEIREKINNSYLRRALKNFAAAYPVARAKALEGIDFEGLRSRISESKRGVLRRLPELVAEFTRNAENAGATVHFCRTRDDANRTIHRIMQEQGATFLVKSKAMTSEEIELNHYLEKQGGSMPGDRSG